MATVVIGLYETRCECGATPEDRQCPRCGPFDSARRDSSGGSWQASDEQSYLSMARGFGIENP